jgi:hypothetical protein
MIVLLLVLSIFGATVRVGAAQESDRRTFGVVSHSTGPAVSSVYVQLRDDLLGAATGPPILLSIGWPTLCTCA